jgi:hypothetical protein
MLTASHHAIIARATVPARPAVLSGLSPLSVRDAPSIALE